MKDLSVSSLSSQLVADGLVADGLSSTAKIFSPACLLGGVWDGVMFVSCV
jgi:hypothetical protein